MNETLSDQGIPYSVSMKWRGIPLIRYFLFMSLTLLLCGCAAYTATSGQIAIRNDDVRVDLHISDNDREAIEKYYKPSSGNRNGSPPGLAKRGGHLPPGLARRDKLPPGLQGESLPRDLEGRLSRLPASCVRIRIGQDIVLMDRNTRVVFDVVYGIAR
jgi:hypothetical protein